MSGRYALFRWNQAFAGQPGFPLGLDPHWNLAPGKQVLFMRAGGELALGRWGLTPAWLADFSKSPAHARMETLADQAMFRESFAKRRCLLPANGFYEWRGSARKRPYWISSEDSMMFLAGLWEIYPAHGVDYLSVAMITGAAANLRRPRVLTAEEQQLWLDPEASADDLLALLAKPSPTLRERALATFVNDPELDAPECLTPA